MAAKKADAPVEAPAAPAAAEAPAPARSPWSLSVPGGPPPVDRPLAPPAEHGFRGRQVDTTPNEHYTVAGQLAAMPEKG